jgi:predicted kinase
MAEAVIFVGLQGAGKTTYFQAHFASSHAHVSRDIQRTPEREAALIRECFATQRSFVVDDTNGTRAVRAPLIAAARQAGFGVRCFFFDTPVRTAIGRNNHRQDKKPVPVPAILRAAKHLEAPLLEEGFDQIEIITPSPKA